MQNQKTYDEFLKSKIKVSENFGFSLDIEDINPNLKPHNKLMVKWLVEGGRRACFASFGLHKTVTQLETVRYTLEKASGSKGLIVCPLNIKQEFVQDSINILGWKEEPKFIRRPSEMSGDGIYLTNYESIRDGRLDPRIFDVASLDEASVLRGFGGSKTFREFMRLFTGDAGPMQMRRGSDHIKYRFVATATPSPNDYIELLAYADFLGIMDISQAKTRFFKRDSTHADKLTLHAHKEEEFWLWVSSWALFVNKPSDITGDPKDDEGYILPELDLRWHEIPADHVEITVEKNGQMQMFKTEALGLEQSAKEKRLSLDSRIKKMLELRAEDPGAHRIIWHDLEDERHAIDKAIPGITSIYGSQDYEKREKNILDFSYGRVPELSAKPVIAGSGCNFQRYCSWAIYLGIGYKFNDFIQSIHRLQRFLQKNTVRVDLIYTETEKNVRKSLERKWQNHNKLIKKMTEIIRKYGLSHAEMAKHLARKMGVERIEITGNNFKVVNNDSIPELSDKTRYPDNSVGLILTSIPFSTQYEYSPNYADLGHSESNEEFFQQMDYLTPNLFRVLQPGRIAAIHVKDRIVPMGLSKAGVQTVYPFHIDTYNHFVKHGFAYMGMKTIVTDVVRENNQTYRLGWTEQCKDGTKMGVGMPEYLLYFRKPQTDRTNAYADIPVEKGKKEWDKINEEWINPDGYSRARWQFDAAGYTRSDGNRGVTPEELAAMDHKQIFQWFKNYTLNEIWDFEYVVKVAETLEMQGKLPSGFMLLQPQSWTDEVWTDVTRMRTLNGSQWSKGKEMHLCLAKGSLILTKDGYKEIQNINIGDNVLTHNGNWKPVIAKACTGINPIVQVKAQGVANLTLTSDHKVWARKNNKARPLDYLPSTEPAWIESKDTKGGFVNLKLPEIEESQFTENEWWLIGRYLADGHYHGARNQFFISVGNKKIDEFKSICGEFIGHENIADGCSQFGLNISSIELKNMLHKCGHGAENKQVPIEGICLNAEKSEALLSGYLAGDGNKTGNQVTACSVSRALVLGMAMVAQRARGVIASVFAGKKPGKHNIQGREINQKQLWQLSWRNGDRSFGKILDDGAWRPVRDITENGIAETWTIQVADDASYTAEGCIVKNCPLQFDIADRVIEQLSNPGETVLDPFGGLMTVPYRAVLKGRKGIGIELSNPYFIDGAAYCKGAERNMKMPSLFDTLEAI
ncbi:DNA methylase N-4 [Proteiniphilum acetatigenes]|uniref:DNA methylase N-4 n=1 Tax=Proteiniphilum acetatigenes TaxID=294710 RepID=UPI0003827044|nr:DNA methylase N-4 [Proteiniphilum acetatigenes]